MRVFRTTAWRRAGFTLKDRRIVPDYFHHEKTPENRW